jgi:Protein of unknown function (DUF3102)
MGPIDQTVNTTQTDRFVAEITATWQKAVASIIETGRLLTEAKKALGHGQWGKLFTEREDGVIGKLPFSQRTAEMLMEISEHPILSNPKFVSNLPPSWGTLHELCSLPDEAMEAMLADGRIHSELRRRDVEVLYRRLVNEGLFFWQELVDGLQTVIEFMERCPNTNALPRRLVEGMWGEGGVSLTALGKLPQWLAGLHAACQQSEEAFWKESEQQEREAAEAQTDTRPRTRRDLIRENRDKSAKLFDRLQGGRR